jgi:hypothetical protein
MQVTQTVSWFKILYFEFGVLERNASLDFSNTTRYHRNILAKLSRSANYTHHLLEY